MPVSTLIAVPKKHAAAKICFHAYSGAEKAYTPQKASGYQRQDYSYHWQAYPVKQEIHVEHGFHTVIINISGVHAVDGHFIKLGNDELYVIDGNKCGKPEQIPADVF